MAYGARRARARQTAGGNIKINGDRLREPMQKVTDKFKEHVGLTKEESFRVMAGPPMFQS